MPLVQRLSLLLVLEGVAVLAIGLAYGGYSLAQDAGAAVLAAAAAVVAGLVLFVLGRAVGRERSWARSPAVVFNVLPLPLAVDAFQGGAWWAGVPLLLVPITVLYLFATPELREALRE